MRNAMIKYNIIQAGILNELDICEFVYDESYIQIHPDLFISFHWQSTLMNK
jgi:hypothetical protein